MRAGLVSGSGCHDELMLTRAITIELGARERKEAAPSRRFPVSVSSDTPVGRKIFGERYEEVLSHERGAVDLSRAPLPLLEGHDHTRTNVGIVTNLRVTGGRLRGELVLGASQRALELAEDIGAGIVSGLSVGYTIDAEARDEKAKRITATRWTPYEVSITPIPADTTVGINRSRHMDEHEHEEQERTTSTEITTPAPEVLAERERVRYIGDADKKHKLGAEFVRRLVDSGRPLEQVRRSILDELVRRQEADPITNHIRVGGPDEFTPERSPVMPGSDVSQDFHRAAIDSLLLRAGIRIEKPHAAARDVSASTYDLARMCLSRAGKSGGSWLRGEARGPDLIKRAMSTSDFPAVLSGALHASIRSGYEQEPATHRAWVRVAPIADFRSQERPILGSAPSLQQVPEEAEYPHGSLTDDTTSYTVSKYGVMVALSWETLINDNLGTFLRVQPALGQAARRKEADLVYAIFAAGSGAGPNMQDGTALFHANHANLVSSQAAIDATNLGTARTLLRKQTAVGGGILGLAPRFLIIPAERETAAEVLLANATRRTTAEKTTPEWIANLELVVEPRLANTGAFLAADSGQIDTVELGLLEENMSGPVLDEEEDFKRDVKRWKVRHVMGVKPLDWRGLVRMPLT